MLSFDFIISIVIIVSRFDSSQSAIEIRPCIIISIESNMDSSYEYTTKLSDEIIIEI